MSLIIDAPVVSFDLSQIKCGDLIWGKHYTWNEGYAGFVASAKKDQLIVQYYPGIGNVTNHFIIPVNEAAAKEWEIRWSKDLAEVYEHNAKKDDEQQETEGNDESGTADL